MLAGGPLIFKTALQRFTAQSRMEAELISMALASEEGVNPSKKMAELGFGKLFHIVPLFVDNTGALHIAGNRTYRPTILLSERAREGRADHDPSRGDHEAAR